MKVSVFGDSIRCGYGISIARENVVPYTDRLYEGYEYENHSRTGADVGDVIYEMSVSSSADVYHIGCGLNNLTRLIPPHVVSARLCEAIEYAKKKSSKTVVEYVVPVNVTYFLQGLEISEDVLLSNIDYVNSAIEETYGNDERVIIIPHKRLANELTIDGVHPNAAGERILYEECREILESKNFFNKISSSL